MSGKRRQRPRRRFRSRMTVLYTMAGMGVLVALFALALGANRVEQLERRRTQLQEEIDYERDEYRRMLTSWIVATSREHVVARAQTELQLVEASAERRTLLVLPEEKRARPGLHPFLDQLARGFDRYGDISNANAGERP